MSSIRDQGGLKSKSKWCLQLHFVFCNIWDLSPWYVLTIRDGEWDFNWCDVAWLRENFDHSYMEEHVRINHFRNHYEVRLYMGKHKLF